MHRRGRPGAGRPTSRTGAGANPATLQFPARRDRGARAAHRCGAGAIVGCAAAVRRWLTRAALSSQRVIDLHRARVRYRSACDGDTVSGAAARACGRQMLRHRPGGLQCPNPLPEVRPLRINRQMPGARQALPARRTSPAGIPRRPPATNRRQGLPRATNRHRRPRATNRRPPATNRARRPATSRHRRPPATNKARHRATNRRQGRAPTHRHPATVPPPVMVRPRAPTVLPDSQVRAVWRSRLLTPRR